ncbi:MAG TPA: glycoside hydrolase family 57 protein [Burkholderiales bacterium]|nr:glycoside hydrolase family 57 protein [Burkholderiales bacterium]
MTTEKNLDLILLWHMHQPDFRDPRTGEFALPWVYLHAIKDYTDMAAHLERHSGMHAAVNLVPLLLDQIEDYAAQFGRKDVRDPLLRLLAREDLKTLSPGERQLILQRCFLANHHKMIEPFASYKRLHDLFTFARERGADPAHYLSSDYLGDLLTWYHLSWMGETVRRTSDLVPQLMAKGERFSAQDRRALFELIGQLVSGVVPRYRKLAQSGQVELTASPYAHPIGPLLLDLRAAREAQPDLPLPDADRYPAGRSRLRWHIERALRSHEQRFGAPPRGLWPSEGAISTDFLQMLAAAGLQWTASGEGVLANSLRRLQGAVPPRQEFLYRPYRVGRAGQEIYCFFRDDRLSDLIGFEYSRWHGRDAVAHFVGQLDAIRSHAREGETPLVAVILDGENAWEFYPYNGYYFLDELYEALEKHPHIRTWTPSAYLDALAALPETQRRQRTGALAEVVSGSWVYGNLATWIGSPEKNLAWNLLCTAKQGYDMVCAGGRLSAEEAESAAIQLAVCEGSDWFWWFGDYNPAETVISFDQLYREKLSQLYRTLHLPVPEQLSHPISRGGGQAEMGGAMRRAS